MPIKDQYSTNLGLSVLPEVDQSKHPQIYLELLRMRAAFRSLQGALDNYTGALSEDPQYWNQVAATQSTRIQNIARIYCITSEAISLAQMVNLYNNAGVLTARKAYALDNTKPARAYCAVPGGVAAGAYGEFVILGVNPFFAGLTPGSIYYLSASTPGSITATAPVTVGNIVQQIGFALDANNLWSNPDMNPLQL